MALDPVLAAGVAPPKFASPLDIYGKMVDIRKGQYENDIYEGKLADLKRDREALATLQAQISKAGGPDNLPEAAKAMIASGIPHFMDFGFKINEKLNFQKQFGDLMNPPAASSQEPQQPAKPPVAFTSPIDRPIDEQGPARFSVSEGITPNKLAQMVSAAAPAIGAPVNNLLPSSFTRNVDAQIAELERKRSGMSLLAGQDPRLMPLVAEFSRQISELKKPQTFSPGQIVSVPGQPNIQIPFAPTTSQQEFILSEQNPNFFKFLADRSAAMRAPPVPVQPVAPTVTQITDPTNPSQMISVNAREYRGGGVGSPGVIGVGGKVPQAAAQEEKLSKGKDELSGLLTNMRNAYENLEKLGGISSTKKSSLSNLSASMGASDVGQALGRAVGTQESTERDVIKNSRLQLTNAIKNATGMSAQQLNSNVELQNMLNSLSDPKQSIETVRRTLNQIENTYLKGKTPSVASSAAASLNIPQEAINFLKQGKGTPEQFDELFGAGAAKKVLGK